FYWRERTWQLRYSSLFATPFHLPLWTAFLGTLVALLMRVGYLPVLPWLRSGLDVSGPKGSGPVLSEFIQLLREIFTLGGMNGFHAEAARVVGGGRVGSCRAAVCALSGWG